jgi:hypothetical protein
MARSAKQVFGLFFLGIAGVLVLIALVQVISTLLFLNRATDTYGRVTDYEQVQNQIAFMEDTGYLYYPVVEFETERGERYTFVSPSGRSERIYETGQEVPVRYLPQDPNNAKLSSFLGTWGQAAVFGGLAALFGVLGLITPYGFRPSKRVYP